MNIDCIVAEIGSTTTVVNAFDFSKQPHFLGRGLSHTTVESDVSTGLKNAMNHLKEILQTASLDVEHFIATSSAAGGLRMCVSGLVYDMTVRAAKEAALNAGANLHLVTAGNLDEDDLEQIEAIRPNIMLVAGGTDYGEKSVAFNNLLAIADLKLDIPLIYAGNVENHYKINKTFKDHSQGKHISIVENVYPRVDFMNIAPLRKVIYETFEAHIVEAKGMHTIRDMVTGSIMPTPGSVMESTMVLHRMIGNVMVIDVGGATTDVHSVTEPSDEFKIYLEGEPKEKRTVEGDLGVYVNLKHVVSTMDKARVLKRLKMDEATFDELVETTPQIPESEAQKALVEQVCAVCVERALLRHVGDKRKVYTSSGQKVIPEGRDATQVNTIVLTGGALLHARDAESIVRNVLKRNPESLLPHPECRVVKDKDYILSSAGVLSLSHENEAQAIIRQSLNIKG